MSRIKEDDVFETIKQSFLKDPAAKGLVVGPPKN